MINSEEKKNPEKIGPFIANLGTWLDNMASFLTQADKVKLAAVHPLIRELILNPQYWPVMQLNDQIESDGLWFCYLQWFTKSIRTLNPQSLTISIFQRHETDLQKLMSIFMVGTVQSIQKVDLYCESEDIHLACSLSFPKLKQLTLRSKCASDDLVSYMFENLKEVISLVVIKNQVNYTGKGITRYNCSRPMEKIIIKPYLIDFGEIVKLNVNSCESLRELEIDLEQCPEELIVSMIKPLQNLQKLRLFHLENLNSDEELWYVLKEQKKLSELTLTKSYNFTMERILSCIKSINLLVLDITDSKYASDQDIIELAAGSPNLKKVNLSWCNNVNCQGLIGLFEHCLKLQSINITGLKDAKDCIFGPYQKHFENFFNDDIFYKTKKSILEQGIEKIDTSLTNFFPEIPEDELLQALSSIKILKNVKEFDCHNCNSVSDKILRLFYVINRKAKVHNYYGEVMSLYANEYQGDFC